jgi:hypothetical protein
MSDKPSFFSELKRRNVYKVAVAYAVVGWLTAQIATQIFPFLEIPNWIVRLVIALIAIGFPIALVIAWAFEATPEGIKRTEVADAKHEHSRGKTWIYVVIIGAAISVALFFVGRYTAGNNASAARTELPAKSIAVLPFENLSDDKGAAYFADGIQDEVLTKLASIADLKVISRTSTAKYKSKPEERAYRENDGGDIYNIRIDPMLDDLRGDPRFEALAEKIVPAREFGNAQK